MRHKLLDIWGNSIINDTNIKCGFVIAMIANVVTPMQSAGFALMLLMTVWSALYLLVRGVKRLFIRENILPGAIVLLYCITIVANFDASLLFGYTKDLASLVVYLFVLLPCRARDEQARNMQLEKVNHVFVLAAFVPLLVGAVMYIFTIYGVICSVNGSVLIGNYDTRYNSLYTNPNAAGVLCMCALCAALFNMRNGCYRRSAVYWLTVISSLIVLVYTASRGTWISVLAMGAVYGFMWWWNRSRNSSAKRIRRVITMCLCGIVLSAGVLTLIMATAEILPSIKSNIISIQKTLGPNEAEIQDAFLQETIQKRFKGGDINRGDKINRSETTELSNGRFEIWREQIVLFTKYPLLGTTSAGKVHAAFRAFGDNPTDAMLMDTHNMYLRVLVVSGAMGFAAFVALMFTLAKKAICKLMDKNMSQSINIFLFAFVAANLVHATTIDGLLFSDMVMTSLFWPYIGYLIYSEPSPRASQDMIYEAAVERE